MENILNKVIGVLVVSVLGVFVALTFSFIPHTAHANTAPSTVSSAGIQTFHDDARRITCFTYANAISCVHD